MGLRAVLALRRLAERVEAEQVALARDQGWSWQQIADVPGMTRQSVHAKQEITRSRALVHPVRDHGYMVRKTEINRKD